MNNENVLPEFKLDLDFGDNPEIETEVINNPDPVVQPDPEKEVEPVKVEVDPNAEAVFKIYADEGILDPEMEFDGTYDSIRNGLLKQQETLEEQLFNAMVSNVPEYAQPLIELSLLKGRELTKDELVGLINGLVTEDTNTYKENPEAYLTKYYKENLNFDDEIVEDVLANLKDKNKLASEAERIYSTNRKTKEEELSSNLEQIKQQKEQARKQAQQFQESFIKELETNYQKPRARQLYNEFYSGGFKNKVEKIAQNPKNLRAMLEFVSYFDDQKEEFDFETYKKEAFSPNVNKVKDKVKEYWSSNKNTKSIQTDDNGGNKVDLSKFKITI